ncbi:MAG TPA: WecB/TagA/CpsF family glycosyltransferase [Alloacidobacterium sp.]|nr:WecB/TagA/CpsF family glycosyltransferase [Alloacidobacterium sp.]
MATTLPYTAAVLGVPFHGITIDEAVRFIEDKIDQGGFHQVATANVDFLRHSMKDKALQEILCSCDLVVPDGMPILWAAKLMGRSLKERVCGIDLVPKLAALCVRRNFSMYLLGAAEATSAKAADKLIQAFPGLRIAGRYSPPPASLEDMDHDDILQRIAEAKPDILLVAFGNPKQEKWISMHRDSLNVPVCIGVGGSLDFIAGATKRAPLWMQKSGLEWLHRVSREPGRLAKRYFHDIIDFAFQMPTQYLTAALQPKHKTRPGVYRDRIESTDVISVYGDFTEEAVNKFHTMASASVERGRNLVLNLAETTCLGTDALGALIQVSSAMRESSRELWLAAMQPQVRRMLHGAHLNMYFMMTSSVDDAIHRAERAEQQHYAPAVTSFSNRASLGKVQVRFEFLQGICQTIAAGAPLHKF